MAEAKTILKDQVRNDWIDYNGHMNDAEYARVFSMAVDAFIDVIGLDANVREQEKYTMFTLENHICYLDEMKLDEDIHVHAEIIDYDAKRIHLFLELYGADEKRAATSEQMLMGMDEETGRPGPFPNEVGTLIDTFYKDTHRNEVPKEIGRVIGIRRKK